MPHSRLTNVVVPILLLLSTPLLMKTKCNCFQILRFDDVGNFLAALPRARATFQIDARRHPPGAI